LVDPQLHALVTLAAIRNGDGENSGARIIAMVERAPSLTATTRARLMLMIAALPGDSLAESRAWAKDREFAIWVNSLLANS
jgi:hypothetical protein